MSHFRRKPWFCNLFLAFSLEMTHIERKSIRRYVYIYMCVCVCVRACVCVCVCVCTRMYAFKPTVTKFCYELQCMLNITCSVIMKVASLENEMVTIFTSNNIKLFLLLEHITCIVSS